MSYCLTFLAHPVIINWIFIKLLSRQCKKKEQEKVPSIKNQRQTDYVTYARLQFSR